MSNASRHIDQTAVAERIRFLIRRLGLSQADFAKRLGIDPANMSKHLNGRLPVTAGLINRIAVDLGVSKHWLTTGADLPVDKPSAHPRNVSVDAGSVSDAVLPDATPIYDIDVTAGATELSREFTADRMIGSMRLPSVSANSVIVRVSGDSMHPEILDGSYIAIRPVSDPSCIAWGLIYVVVLDDYRLVKRVCRHADPQKVILRSANPLYDDMEVDRGKIRAIYLVETILNVKTQC